MKSACLISLFRSIKPFECCHSNTKQSPYIDKSSLINSIYEISNKIYEQLPSQASCSKSCRSFLGKKKIVLKNGLCKTTQSIKKIALFIFRKSISLFQKLHNPFSEDIEPIQIIEIKRYLLKISMPRAGESKYCEIKTKYENYIKKSPYPILNEKKIYFDDALKQILLTISLDEFEKIKDIDPTSRKPIVEIDYGMEIEYKLFGVPIEIKNI